MAAARNLPLDAQIDAVEQRMAQRRARIVADVAATRAHAQRAKERALRWLPLAGVGGALVVGFVAARSGRASAGAVRVASPPVPPSAPRGRLAAIIALAAGALRFAASAEGRMAWRALKTARDHARGRRHRMEP